MKKLLLSCAAGLCVAACSSSSSDPCQTYSSSIGPTFSSDIAPCAPVLADAGITFSFPAINTTKCETVYAACTPTDQYTLTNALNALNTCVSAQKACVPAQAFSWLPDAGTCSAIITTLATDTALMKDGGVSAGCGAGLEDAGFAP